MRATFVERSLLTILGAADRAASAERIAGSPGLLQSIDPRAKLAGFAAMIISVAIAHNVATLGAALLGSVLMAIAGRLPLRLIAKSWGGVLFFSGMIALPALFTTPGTPIGGFAGAAMTAQGFRSAQFLLLRVATTSLLALILVTSTGWPHVIAALRALRVPATVVLILSMSYRYVFVLLGTAEEMFVARRSRSVGRLAAAEGRRMATATAGVLLGKSLTLADDVHQAMRARGFRGDVVLLDPFTMRARDWVALSLFSAAAAVTLWSGLR